MKAVLIWLVLLLGLAGTVWGWAAGSVPLALIGLAVTLFAASVIPGRRK